jgi:pyrophosphatase PpaX
MQKLAIFDFDGCLAHTLDAWLIGARSVFDKLGLTPTDKEIVDNVFAKDHGPLALGVTDLDAFWSDNVDAYYANQHHVHLHEGVVDTLSALKANGIHISILTRTERRSINLMFELFPELASNVEFVVTREDVEHHKPHPEGIYAIQDHFKTDSAHTFMIGDSEHDVLAGESAGATTILYYPPHNEAFYTIDEINALDADHIVHSFSEMIPIMI